MGAIFDIDTTEVQLDDGQSLTLTVDTDSHAEDIIVLVDDGASGSTAAAYDLLAEVDPVGDGSFQYYDEVTGRTGLSWQDPAVGKQMQYTLTNQSGSNGETYRVMLLSQE